MSRKKSEPVAPPPPTQSIQAASQPDPLEQRRRDFLTNLDKWRSGESGPIDVRNMPGSGVGMSLFQEAKRARDEGRIGKGVASMSGENKEFATALDKENQIERDLAASGQLENYVDNQLAGLDAEMGNYAQMGNARNMDVANLNSQNYWNYWNYRNNKKPGFWKQVGLGLASNV